MGFAIRTYNIGRIRSFEDAEKHFNNTKKPRTEKWCEYQRPLRNTAARHLRLEKGEYAGVTYYDCMLYQTAMVRYFQPQPNGERAVWLVNHHSTSSQNFLWTMGWHNRKILRGNDGEEFPLQLSSQSSVAVRLWGDEFTTKLIFNADGNVILDRSVHVPFARKASSTTRRAKRKELVESLSMIFDMMEMQYSSFVSDIMVDSYKGQPFTSKDWGADFPKGTYDKLRTTGLAELDANQMTSVVHFATRQCHNNARSIVNRRAYDYRGPSYTTWAERQRLMDEKQLPVDNVMLDYHSKEVQDVLTPTWDDLRESLKNDFLWLCKMEGGDEFLPYPQFAKTYAQRCYTIRVGAADDLSNVLGIETYCKLTSRKGVVY